VTITPTQLTISLSWAGRVVDGPLTRKVGGNGWLPQLPVPAEELTVLIPWSCCIGNKNKGPEAAFLM
jgi:hypothetical protein